MTTFTAAARPGEYLGYEADHDRSHDQITVALSQTLVAGQVIGKLAVGVPVVTASAVTGTGNGVLTLAGTPYVANCQPGVYKVVFIEPIANLGTFQVFDPNGKFVNQGFVGTAFSTQIAFTIADGSTDFLAGDNFSITVAPATTYGQVVAYDPAATNGAQFAAGVLFAPVTTSGSATKRGVITARAATVNGNCLTWPSGISAANKAVAIAALNALGIIVRY